MAYENAGIELELKGAEAYISNAKQVALQNGNMFDSIAKMGGVNISGLNAFSSGMKDLVKVGQDVGKSAVTAAGSQDKLGQAFKKSSLDLQLANIKAKEAALALDSAQKPASALSIVTQELGSRMITLAGNVGTGILELSKLAAITGGAVVKGLLDVGSAAGGAAWAGISKLGSMAVDAARWVGELAIKSVEAAGKFAISFGKDAVKAAMDFDKQMSEVASVAGATPAQLAKMSDEALRLGAVFPVSATDAAKAMTELGKAGFTTDQILAASTGTVQLASATHYSMADSATVLANAINQFGLKAADAGRVTDLLAAAANSSAVDVKDLAKTFEYVGPVAQAAGFSIEDVAKATSVMGNAGIKGSSAGTGLKAVLSSLVNPGDKAAAAFKELGYSVTGADGKIKPLQSQLTELREKFKGLSAQQQVDLATKIVGVNHFSKLLAVMNATDESFNQVSTSIDNASGAGARMAAVMNDNLAGAVENLKGSFETLQIKAGKAFQPILKDLANLGSLILNKLTPYVDIFAKKFQTGYLQVLTTSKEVFKSWDLFRASFTSGFQVPPAWTGLAATMARLGEALSPLKQAFSDLVTAIMPAPVESMAAGLGKAGDAAKNAHPVIDAISFIVKNVMVPGIEKAAQVVDSLQLAFGKIKGVIGPLLPQIGDFATKALAIYQAVSPLNIALDAFTGFMTGGLGGAIDAVGQHVTDLGKVFGVDLSGSVATVTGYLKTDLVPAIGDIVKGVSEALPKIIAFGQGFISTVLPPIQSFVGWIVANVGPLVSSAFDTFTTTVMPALGRFGDFISTNVLPKLESFAGWFGATIVPVLSQFIAFVTDPLIPTLGLIAAVILDTVIPVITNWVGVIATVLTPIITALVNFISGTVIPVFSNIASFIGSTVIPAFREIGSFINANVMPVLTVLASYLGGGLTVAFQNIGTVVGSVWNVIQTVIKTAWDVISGVFNIIKSVLSGDFAGAWTAFQGVIGSVWKGVGDLIANAWNTISGIFDNITGFLGGTFKGAWDALKTAVETVWNGIVAAVTGAKGGLDTLFNGIKSAIDAVGVVWNALVDTVKTGAEIAVAVATGDWGHAWDLITGKAKSGAQDASREVDKLGNDIGSKDFSGPARTAGGTIGSGMAAGIRAAAGAVANAAASIAQQAIDAARSRLSSQSPSKEFIKVGYTVPQGFAIGIDQGTPLVESKMVDLVGNMNQVVKDKRPEFRSALDDLMVPIAKISPYLDRENPVIGRSMIDIIENLGLVTDMKSGIVSEAITHLLQPIKGAADVIGAIIGSSQDPSKPLATIMDNMSSIVGNAAKNFGGNLDAYIEHLRRLRSALEETMANWPAMPGPPTSGAGGTPLPGGGGGTMPLPTGGSPGTLGMGGSHSLANPASASQISNMFANSSVTNAPVVNNYNNNQSYNLGVHTAGSAAQAVQYFGILETMAGK